MKNVAPYLEFGVVKICIRRQTVETKMLLLFQYFILNKYNPCAGAGGAHIDLFFDWNALLKSFKFHLPSPKYFIEPTIDLTCC